MPRKNDRLHLRRLAVDAAFRRQGITRAFVEHVSERAKDAQLRALSLYTIEQTGNVPIFERLGFRRLQEVPAIGRSVLAARSSARCSWKRKCRTAMGRRIRIALFGVLWALAMAVFACCGWSYWQLSVVSLQTSRGRYELVSAEGMLIILNRRGIIFNIEFTRADPYFFIPDLTAGSSLGIGRFDDGGSWAFGVAYGWLAWTAAAGPRWYLGYDGDSGCGPCFSPRRWWPRCSGLVGYAVAVTEAAITRRRTTRRRRPPERAPCRGRTRSGERAAAFSAALLRTPFLLCSSRRVLFASLADGVLGGP